MFKGLSFWSESLDRVFVAAFPASSGFHKGTRGSGNLKLETSTRWVCRSNILSTEVLHLSMIYKEVSVSTASRRTLNRKHLLRVMWFQMVEIAVQEQCCHSLYRTSDYFRICYVHKRHAWRLKPTPCQSVREHVGACHERHKISCRSHVTRSADQLVTVFLFSPL